MSSTHDREGAPPFQLFGPDQALIDHSKLDSNIATLASSRRIRNPRACWPRSSLAVSASGRHCANRAKHTCADTRISFPKRMLHAWL